MSLISEALKKVEQEREKFRKTNQNEDQTETKKPVLTGRNYLFVLLIIFTIIGTVVITVTLSRKPIAISQNKSLTSPDQPSPKDTSKQKPPEKQVAEVIKKKIAIKTDTRDKTIPSSTASTIMVKNITPKITKNNKKDLNLDQKSEYQRIVARGDSYLKRYDFISASQEYKSALKLERPLLIYLKLYSCFKGMRNQVLARVYIDEGLKHYHDNFSLNKISAILFIRNRKFSQALVNIELALKKSRSDYSLFTYRGLCHFHLKKFVEAEKNFSQSLTITTDAVENYYYIGLIYDNRQKFRVALANYKKFLNMLGDKKYFKHKNWVTARIRALERNLFSTRINQ